MIMLSKNDYLKVIEKTTLTAVDLIVYHNKKILFGLRNNNPAKGFLFTMGCRTGKYETLNMGITRVAKSELNIDIDHNKVKLVGVYDHIYDNNFNNQDFGTHYVVSAFLIELTDSQVNNIKSDSQHSKLEWIDIDDIMNHDNIHILVKNYLPNIKKILKI